ncbi:hypothetical protein CHS0354_037609 [Potamilus streckersoni]|uniref:Oxidative stress-responsive serine-rich protein 1 n=1 Tax=Potamilus streckersoni TaxID=2493646 RepID=A0AAE0RZ10_9BIVA|nr:hypothetical protein CHS0354_037609 [Potamilus streckersoni]
MMGGEEQSTSKTHESTDLHTAFKRLKVDPDWNSRNIVANAQNISLKELWSRDAADVKKDTSNDTGKSKTRSPSTSRVEPYPQDFVYSMQKLNFHSETCQSKTCHCGELRLKSKVKQKFNYAHCSVSSKPVIREARLKIHHSEKDCKQVIRAAKLKLHKLGKKPVKKEKAILNPTRIPGLPSNIESLPVFGSAIKLNSRGALGFADVDSESPKRKVSIDNTPTYSFKDFQTHYLKKGNDSPKSDSRERKSDSMSDEVLPAREQTSLSKQESLYSVEQSCSQQARLEETSVNELACYFEEFVHIPKKMSTMAEMMYT